jgi:acyl-CoA thioester hydrolase
MAQHHVYELQVPASAIDANGHANNVEFVRWMQEAAIAHADISGCTAATTAAGCTWFTRAHRVEYRQPAFAGDRLRVRTWVENIRRVFSLRKYVFERVSDNALLASGETDWVFIDVTTGRPKSIPPSVQAAFDLSDISTR